MDVTVLIKYLHYYKLNIISRNKATGIFEVALLFQLGACKISITWKKGHTCNYKYHHVM